MTPNFILRDFLSRMFDKINRVFFIINIAIKHEYLRSKTYVQSVAKLMQRQHMNTGESFNKYCLIFVCQAVLIHKSITVHFSLK